MNVKADIERGVGEHNGVRCDDYAAWAKRERGLVGKFKAIEGANGDQQDQA